MSKKRKPGRPKGALGEKMIKFRERIDELLPGLGDYGKRSDFLRDIVLRELYSDQPTLDSMLTRTFKRLQEEGKIVPVKGAIGFFEIKKEKLL